MPYADPEVRKKKHKEYSRRHYEKDKEANLARIRANKRRYRKRWDDFKATLKCINCGFNHPAALDFHHVIKDPDNEMIHELLRRNSYARVMEETKKCVVLCANCHRVHHYDEHQVKVAKRRKKKSDRLD